MRRRLSSASTDTTSRRAAIDSTRRCCTIHGYFSGTTSSGSNSANASSASVRLRHEDGWQTCDGLATCGVGDHVDGADGLRGHLATLHGSDLRRPRVGCQPIEVAVGTAATVELRHVGDDRVVEARVSGEQVEQLDDDARLRAVGEERRAPGARWREFRWLRQ